MAISSSTFSDLGGAVSDLFGGLGAGQKAALQAQGLRITAQGTLITAQGTELNAEALGIKATGDLAEASNYDLAAQLAQANEAYTEQSTRLQEYQTGRQVTQAIGAEKAGTAGAGFAAGGSAGDLLRMSASQGSLAKAALEQQNAITVAGEEEQANSYKTLAATGRQTAAVEQDMQGKTETIATEQKGIAGQQMQLATQTEEAARTQETGDFIGAALKGAAAVASVFAAPVTGGASLAAGAAVTGGLDALGAIH